MKSKKMFVVLLTAVLLFSLYILASRTRCRIPHFLDPYRAVEAGRYESAIRISS